MDGRSTLSNYWCCFTVYHRRSFAACLSLGARLSIAVVYRHLVYQQQVLVELVQRDTFIYSYQEQTSSINRSERSIYNVTIKELIVVYDLI